MRIEKKRMMKVLKQKGAFRKMLQKTDIDQIQNLGRKGMAKKKIASQLGFSRNTVKKYIHGTPERKERKQSPVMMFLNEHCSTIRGLFIECGMHCIPTNRRIHEMFGMDIHLRTLQRFCAPFREEMQEANDTIRFETRPGQQSQVDFGQAIVEIAGRPVRIHLFVSILAYCRRIFAKAYYRENQSSWFDGMESAFVFFGGIPLEVVSDNTKCLVREHGARRAVRFTSAYQGFCTYWGIHPIACTPGYPQSKGKVERAIQYVKVNALPGRRFETIAELNAWLEQWSLTVSDRRQLGNEIAGLRVPYERYLYERTFLQPIEKPRIASVREETRKVNAQGFIRVDNQYYRVPDRFINQDVDLQIEEESILVSRKGRLIAELDARFPYCHEVQDHKRGLPVQLQDCYPEYQKNPLQRSLSRYEEYIGAMVCPH